MTSDLLGISITGLRVSQSALSTTGHNISNAGVDGFSRQKVDAITNPASLQGAGYVGNGASVDAIERVANQFVIKQVRTDTSLNSDLSTYQSYVSQLDNLLSDENTGLAGALDSFYSSVNNGANDPTSIPARQLILTEGENVSNRFNTVYSRFEQIESSVNDALNIAVAEVNALIKNVASINGRIGDAVGSGNGALPNDLLDQRDETLRQLSSLLTIQTFEQNNGEVNVLIGNGQNVVVGREARNIDLQASQDDPSKFNIVFQSNSIEQNLTQLISGGEIGGLIRFRDNALDTSFNQFGQIAVAVADQFNTSHQQGITLDNEFGQKFFSDVNTPIAAQQRVISNSNNTGQTPLAQLNIKNTQAMQGSDYTVTIEPGGLYRIHRDTDGEEVTTGLVSGAMPFSIEFDGLELAFNQGTLNAGDAFTLKPTRFAAKEIQSQLFDPRTLAFGTPLSTEASLGNRGSAQISSGEVLSLTDTNNNPLPLLQNPGELDPPLIVRFTSPTTYSVLNNSDPGNPTDLDPPIRNKTYIAGLPNSIFTEDKGQTVIAAKGELLGIPSGKTPIIGTGQKIDNGYPAEAITFTLPPAQEGGSEQTKTVYTGVNASAKEIANTLNNVPGVTANAFNYIEISNLKVNDTSPLQIGLNGQDLLDYELDPISGLPALVPAVPNPTIHPTEFNDYLANIINTNDDFQQLGISAVSSIDSLTSNPILKITSTQGDDLQIDLIASNTESISVSDGTNDDIVLAGQGAGATSGMVAGGQLDVTLNSDVSMRTFPPVSTIFGDSAAPDFAKSSFLGIQVSLAGSPIEGDDFTIDFNLNGASDNRNALNLVNTQTQSVLANGNATIGEGYASLVEFIGIDTSSATINANASEQVLEQTTQTRNSISAVNLDEEAANLIKFEQMYQANAQVISVARNLFDTLIGSF